MSFNFLDRCYIHSNMRLLANPPINEVWSYKNGKNLSMENGLIKVNESSNYIYLRWEWFDTLINKINIVSHKIFANSYPGPYNFIGNWVEANIEIISVLESMKFFQWTSNKKFIQPEHRGILCNQYWVMLNQNFPKDKLLVGWNRWGYKGFKESYIPKEASGVITIYDLD